MTEQRDTQDTVNEGDVADAIKIGKIFERHEKQERQAVVEEAGDDIEAEKIEVVQEEDDEIDFKVKTTDRYLSKNRRRGVCILLENDMFHTSLGLSKRKGSSLDKQVMLETFTKLQFEVRVYTNLAVKDVYRTLEKVSMEDLSDCDTFALVILSHGNEGILYGYDGSYPVHKIWQNFTPDHCPSLAGKPKMIFIQACQGNNMDSGLTVTPGTSMSRTSTDSFASYRTPLHADFLLAHSTIAGYYSWRNTVQGSWFIQVLGKVLLANNKTEDVLTMLTKVNQVVALKYESNSSRQEFNNKKQTPFIYSTLIKHLYLQPK